MQDSQHWEAVITPAPEGVRGKAGVETPVRSCCAKGHTYHQTEALDEPNQKLGSKRPWGMYPQRSAPRGTQSSTVKVKKKLLG